jgi:putative phosphoribosyl transferase
MAVGQFYVDFRQLEDAEVKALLDAFEAGRDAAAPGEAAAPARATRSVVVDAGGALLEGDLCIPEGARGVVLFAHGSGSSRRSPRNRRVARALNDAGLATLLIDLLSAEEGLADERTGHLRFDIGLLSQRVVDAARWLAVYPATKGLAIGGFGASTGAAAALVAAAYDPALLRAVVSRGGRPDLAGPALPLVQAPTLLVVGGRDAQVLELNREALAALRCEKRLDVVPGATHLFEEPGTLDEAARLATEWFRAHLGAPAPLPSAPPPVPAA